MDKNRYIYFLLLQETKNIIMRSEVANFPFELEDCALPIFAYKVEYIYPYTTETPYFSFKQEL